jgi:hypothetical protein
VRMVKQHTQRCRRIFSLLGHDGREAPFIT